MYALRIVLANVRPPVKFGVPTFAVKTNHSICSV